MFRIYCREFDIAILFSKILCLQSLTVSAMGKSPGKWIKTILFGKKSSKSNLSKNREVMEVSVSLLYECFRV